MKFPWVDQISGRISEKNKSDYRMAAGKSIVYDFESVND